MNDPSRDSAETIAVAMSGGVDSSVAAALLYAEVEQTPGRLFGVTMRLGDGENEAIVQARAVAEHLGIAHHVIDCSAPFADQVLRTCWDEYAGGRTPNPCMVCNPRIKFGVLFEAARELGATRIATGHHARLNRDDTGRVVLRRGRDRDKDQSYFLARLTPKQLAASLFPIGELVKTRVRELARQLALPTAESKESQDTCIVPDPEARTGEGQFAETLCRRFAGSPQPGDFVDASGSLLGRHPGIHLFTVGQRRGLGVALGRRAYVQTIDATNNRVVLTTDRDALLTRELRASGVQWPGARPSPQEPLSCQVQIRYRHAPVDATATLVDADVMTVAFHEPIRAVTPGQAAVLYDGDRVIASGWIE